MHRPATYYTGKHSQHIVQWARLGSQHIVQGVRSGSQHIVQGARSGWTLTAPCAGSQIRLDNLVRFRRRVNGVMKVLHTMIEWKHRKKNETFQEYTNDTMPQRLHSLVNCLKGRTGKAPMPLLRASSLDDTPCTQITRQGLDFCAYRGNGIQQPMTIHNDTGASQSYDTKTNRQMTWQRDGSSRTKLTRSLILRMLLISLSPP